MLNRTTRGTRWGLAGLMALAVAALVTLGAIYATRTQAAPAATVFTVTSKDGAKATVTVKLAPHRASRKHESDFFARIQLHSQAAFLPLLEWQAQSALDLQRIRGARDLQLRLYLEHQNRK